MSDFQHVPKEVRERGTQVFSPEIFERWLVGSEAFLSGRRPIDVINAGDVDAVLDALDAIAAGGFA